MERVAHSLMHRGAIFDVLSEGWQRGGEIHRRDIVRVKGGGAAAILMYDDEAFWLVSQPREAINREHYDELPAGRIDKGEEPLETAQRELAEELGFHAERWSLIASFYTSPGMTDERIWLYAATDLTVVDQPEADDVVYPVRVPFGELEGRLATADDAKTIIALNWLSELRTRESAEEDV